MQHVKLLRSRDDCRGIIAAAQAARHIVVIGSSFIGLEAAASLRDRGHKVSVVTPEKQPMARIFGSQLSNLIAATHRRHGVDWHVGRKVDQVTEDNVRLDDGTLLESDLVVVGIGVVPRVLGWLRLPASPLTTEFWWTNTLPPVCRTSSPPATSRRGPIATAAVAFTSNIG